MRKSNSDLKNGLLVICLVMSITSCSIKLISDYDDITDKKVTELQEKVANHFVKLQRSIGTNEANYTNFVSFYDEAKVELSTIMVRAQAIDKNDITIKQIVLLTQMLNDFESLHKIGFRTITEIKPPESAFNSAFTAIIKLEMAKKRGEKKQ